ncbi:hypothetical protein JX265_004662 [Neoarthrinium moseri]|uniref:Uncharacterized protein n=1 Tax=Neoarthrinium moseri TaxID=1658444 RepID=A0A9P9WQ71_9PEZI|nr:hypothetical protein JX266_012255 [Neoarthrinium moseri]KAI1874454.1 hypothetical protein JX265_004662 [Neoarthrinium moseri]
MAASLDDLRLQNEEVLDRFLNTPFWESDDAISSLLSRDCILDFPFAPPGMPKSFDRPRRAVLTSWLRRTVKNWSRPQDSIVKYPTKDLSRFWIESRTVADVTWGGPHVRKFDCTHVELVVINDGKVTLARTWSDPLPYYTAAGMNLPIFHYSGRWGVPVPEKQYALPDKIPEEGDEATALRQKLFDIFLRPNYFDTEREGPKKAQWFTKDFMPNMPFMPKGMVRQYNDEFLASCNEWLYSSLVEWDQQVTDFHEDKFLDPNVSIIETNGSRGLAKWDPSGAVSGYFNDYVIMVKLEDFQIAEVKEWLDPVNKLLAAGTMVPCFPFFY